MDRKSKSTGSKKNWATGDNIFGHQRVNGGGGGEEGQIGQIQVSCAKLGEIDCVYIAN